MAASGQIKTTAKLLSKKELIKIVARQQVAGFLPGEWESCKPGSGYDFDGLREFQSGDPISQIDWPARARTGKLYVREFLAESHYNLMLVYDLSASMAWGRKSLLADNIAVSLAWSALRSNNTCGLLLWADGPVFYLPPKSGMEHFVTLVTILAQHQPRPEASFSPAAAMAYLQKLPFQSLTFLLSDLLYPLNEADLMLNGDEIKVLQLLEEVEKEIPRGLSGLLNCTDPETGIDYLLDLGKWRSYNRSMAVFLQQIKEKLLKIRIASTVITPADNFVDKINALLVPQPRSGGLYQA
ncbi:MAG: DUF58 domain-containing protein [Deltaproteobacteria bacterium]|nr:DUF58 domain-containing protein [Deltaproteobacteria bacterium]